MGVEVLSEEDQVWLEERGYYGLYLYPQPVTFWKIGERRSDTKVEVGVLDGKSVLHVELNEVDTMNALLLSGTSRLRNFNRLIGLAQTWLPPEWEGMLKRLQDDSDDGYLGLLNAPAAKENHHPYLGGLVKHMLEMWDFWKVIGPFLEEQVSLTGKVVITDELVLKGILIHDLHKAWRTFKLQNDSIVYGDDPSDKLMTNNIKSIYILMRDGISLSMLEMNVLSCSEGGWAESPPKWCTPLAKLVYLLDEFSGNVLARCLQGNFLDLKGQFSVKDICEYKFTSQDTGDD